MRPVTWDSGVRFGDPNLRCGNPSYLLEPGDPGYTPPALPAGNSTKPKTKKHAMSSNATPRNPKVLRARAHDLADGLALKQAIIGMAQNTEAKVRADLIKIEGDPAAAPGSDAHKGSYALYEACKLVTAQKEAAMVQVSDGPVAAFLLTAQGCLEVLYGKQYNSGWQTAGWPNQSTEIPRTHDQRFTLCNSLRGYLAAHPAHERPGVAPYIPFTADEALARHTTFSDAREEVNTAAGNQEQCRLVLVADEKALSKRYSGTVSEARQLLAADSPALGVAGAEFPCQPLTPAGGDGLHRNARRFQKAAGGVAPCAPRGRLSHHAPDHGHGPGPGGGGARRGAGVHAEKPPARRDGGGEHHRYQRRWRCRAFARDLRDGAGLRLRPHPHTKAANRCRISSSTFPGAANFAADPLIACRGIGWRLEQGEAFASVSVSHPSAAHSFPCPPNPWS